MRKFGFLSVIALVGCTSSIPVMPTGTPHEYVVVARHMASVFSSLEEAKKEAESKAMNYCMGIGKIYSKKYAIDRPMAIGQVPESSLYFTCNTNIENTNPQADVNVNSSSTIKKMEELNVMLKSGLINQDEYNTKKHELLKAM